MGRWKKGLWCLDVCRCVCQSVCSGVFAFGARAIGSIEAVSVKMVPVAGLSMALATGRHANPCKTVYDYSPTNGRMRTNAWQVCQRSVFGVFTFLPLTSETLIQSGSMRHRWDSLRKWGENYDVRYWTSWSKSRAQLPMRAKHSIISKQNIAVCM